MFSKLKHFLLRQRLRAVHSQYVICGETIGSRLEYCLGALEHLLQDKEGLFFKEVYDKKGELTLTHGNITVFYGALDSGEYGLVKKLKIQNIYVKGEVRKVHFWYYFSDQYNTRLIEDPKGFFDKTLRQANQFLIAYQNNMNAQLGIPAYNKRHMVALVDELYLLIGQFVQYAVEK